MIREQAATLEQANDAPGGCCGNAGDLVVVGRWERESVIIPLRWRIFPPLEKNQPNRYRDDCEHRRADANEPTPPAIESLRIIIHRGFCPGGL